mmetsp:Transcript_43463/g.69622  ORF Transcript_43463/g.69622 Transcript_43463/m.69622 type:complete len:200 (-) Transcript_43463:361-960(-)
MILSYSIINCMLFALKHMIICHHEILRLNANQFRRLLHVHIFLDKPFLFPVQHVQLKHFHPALQLISPSNHLLNTLSHLFHLLLSQLFVIPTQLKHHLIMRRIREIPRKYKQVQRIDFIQDNSHQTPLHIRCDSGDNLSENPLPNRFRSAPTLKVRKLPQKLRILLAIIEQRRRQQPQSLHIRGHQINRQQVLILVFER